MGAPGFEIWQSAENNESSLMRRVVGLRKKNSDRGVRFELYDLVFEIDSTKRDNRCALLLVYCDASKTLTLLVRI